MMSRIARIGCIVTLAMSSTAFAQESTNRVAAITDWSVFEDGNCWVVSSPKESVNTDSSGRIKSVRRGDILLWVTYVKGAGGTGEVSFTGGYPFADGSTVNMTIGDSQFELFTDAEHAWSQSAADDAKIVAAMKGGTTAVLSARSGRGTITKDSFSLLGFTAATEEASKRCN